MARLRGFGLSHKAEHTAVHIGVGVGIGVDPFKRDTRIDRLQKPTPIPMPTPTPIYCGYGCAVA